MQLHSGGHWFCELTALYSSKERNEEKQITFSSSNKFVNHELGENLLVEMRLLWIVFHCHATKETHSGLVVVELAAFLAISHFNDGAKALIFILEELGIDAGCHCIAACHKLDYNRVRHSMRKSSGQAKKRRKHLRNWKKGYSETLEAREGPFYEAGAF